ncbi:MAG: PAS domain-containing protein [Chloroflexi bacterium]|nr:ATP-binding protein [Chloroflexota bacterium]MDA1240343.1 ATP-binding protein [Chloroflexota bacterium]MQC19171.1 PAS domain-containing protein [Chloroflexota bacterium]
MKPLLAPSGLLLLTVLALMGVVAVLLLPEALAVLIVITLIVVAALLVERAPAEEPTAPAAPVRPALSDEALRILDLFSEGVLLLDREQRVVAANRAAAAILGRPREAMIGVSLIRAARDHELLEVLRESSAEPREVALQDGRIVYATASAVREAEIRTVLTLQDMTLLRRAERARQDLVANVSHELRTPIAAAFALAETLEAGVDDDAQRARFLGQLTGEVERLGKIVDRLLRLSRIESRSEEFNVEPVEVDGLLVQARDRITPVAERRGVSIEIAGPVGLRVRADRERVLEVLSNLIENALRYSPAGTTVRLRAEVAAGMVQVCVQDAGPGILPADRLRIFERFYTGDRSRTPDGTAGTGLGLAIARHIITRLGGEIWVADAVPGATLCFTLPLVAAPAAPPEA